MIELFVLSIAGTLFGILMGVGFYFGGVIGDYIHRKSKQ